MLSAALLIISCQKNESSLQNSREETSAGATAAGGRKCASQEVLDEQLRTDPERARKLEELEQKTALFQNNRQFRAAGKLYAPVVVNVVLSDANKVSDAQIQSQLDVLNRDYNGTNTELNNSLVYLAGYPYGSVAKCQIEFYIQDWATDVNRRSNTTTTSFGTNDAVKRTASGGLDPESPTTKLNIWVCDLSSGLLGYAQFPGGSSATDGVVIDYQGFGTTASYALYSAYNKGRSATHEIGHWFNLRHIWGDTHCGNDLVGDTPLHTDANYGCPAAGLKSRCSGKPLMQWMNYMDYTDDACMYMFSSGQKTRMDAAIDGPRAAYVSAVKL